MGENINVDYTTLDAAKTTITTKLSEIDGFLANAETAGNDAVTALGGEATPAGKALSSKIVAINLADFKKTKASIESILQGLSNASKTYQDEETAILDAITSFSGNN